MVVALGLLLSACLLAPGKFVSQLDLRKDGRFTFTYSGEMHLLTLTDFAKNKGKSGSGSVFTPDPCHSDSGKQRECTAAELDRQMRAWEDQHKRSSEKQDRESQQMAAMLGGFDASDPKAAEALAISLRKQKGWNKVIYKGKSLFDVEFAIAGTLTHDFIFPIMEGFPMANTFVQVALRNDGTVRIDAPGYSPASMGGPMQGLTQAAMMDGANKDKMPELPQMDGIFTVTTDGKILANNTEEGPQTVPLGSKLTWAVNARTEAEPTALIKMVP